MAFGFPLLTALLGIRGLWVDNDRFIEVPVILMGVAWIQVGLHLRPRFLFLFPGALMLRICSLWQILGLLLLIVGLIWFGVLNVRQRILACWQQLPLLTGLMGFIGFFLFSGEEITAIFLFFRTMFALGLLGLGLVVWLEKPLQLKVAL